jgi:hypothetical protein
MNRSTVECALALDHNLIWISIFIFVYSREFV